MKDLKKLKAVLAEGIERHELFKNAFDVVKDAEQLEKFVAHKESEKKSLEKDIEKLGKQKDKAKQAALDAEKEHAELVTAHQDELANRVQDTQKQVDKIVEEAHAEEAAAKARVKELRKQIKGLETTKEQAEAATATAQQELEDIRGRLKSI